MDSLLAQIAEMVKRGKTDAQAAYPPELSGQPGVNELTREALTRGIAPNDVLTQGLVAGMKVVGDKFRAGEMFLPEVLMAARALNAGFEHLKPHFQSGAIKAKGTIVIGTVAGDLHDIGKKIVGLFFEGGGWKVIDIGVDVPAEKFLAAIEEYKPSAVGLSTLLTTTMASMGNIAREIKNRHPQLKVVVGGAPITDQFAHSIGADFYSPDPQGALDYLNRTM